MYTPEQEKEILKSIAKRIALVCEIERLSRVYSIFPFPAIRHKIAYLQERHDRIYKEINEKYP